MRRLRSNETPLLWMVRVDSYLPTAASEVDSNDNDDTDSDPAPSATAAAANIDIKRTPSVVVKQHHHNHKRALPSVTPMAKALPEGSNSKAKLLSTY